MYPSLVERCMMYHLEVEIRRLRIRDSGTVSSVVNGQIRKKFSALLSEGRPSEMATYCMIVRTVHSGKGKTLETGKE